MHIRSRQLAAAAHCLLVCYCVCASYKAHAQTAPRAVDKASQNKVTVQTPAANTTANAVAVAPTAGGAAKATSKAAPKPASKSLPAVQSPGNAQSTGQPPTTAGSKPGAPVTFGPLPGASADSSPSPGSTTPSVEETLPKIFYLPDERGKLQPVLDFPYQEFVDLYRLKNQLDRREQPPRYSIQRLEIRGAARAEQAELMVQFQILVHTDAWVRIPLRLNQTLLHGKVQYRGSGEQFIHLESATEGYVCWLHGKPDTEHELTLTVLAPLAVVGEESRLKLSLPRAAAAELKLTVPLRGVSATVSDDATLLPPAEVEKDKTPATELTVLGVSGDFELAWHKQSRKTVEVPVALESVGAVFTRLDGRTITSEATLTVRSYGAAFDRFTVRLPPGAEVAAGTGITSAYVVAPLEPTTAPTKTPRLVEVRLAKKSAGPVEVRLNCTRPYDPTASQDWCELAGFEVVGAIRQWGSLAVAVGGNWQILWGPSKESRQVDQIPEALRRDDVVACFEYALPAFSLLARLTPRKTRISVDPEYVLLVEQNQVQLEGTLSYRVRGAKVATLEVAMPGWELTDVGPDNLVANDGATSDQTGLATIPLAQRMVGDFRVQIRARRAIPAGAKSLTVTLPRPRSSAAASFSVVVVPADNVELVPNAAGMEGLVRQRTEPPMKLPERQQEAFYYRGTGAAGVFAAEFRLHAQRVNVDVNNELVINDRAVTVEQNFAYTVAYEPLDHLMFTAPPAALKAAHFEILYDGKPLSPVVEKERSAKSAGATSALRVLLPRPQIGRFTVALRYEMAVPALKTDAPTAVGVPLVMPRDGEISSNRAFVQMGRNASATLRDGPWRSDESEGHAGRRDGLAVAATEPTTEIGFDVRREESGTAGAVLVDRAWIQTWLTPSARQDRAVFQIVTNHPEIEVQLPAGVAARQALVLVGGQRVDCSFSPEEHLLIPLTNDGDEHRYTVEMQYQLRDLQPRRSILSLDLPHLGNNSWVRWMYWQLVLPPNEHVVVDPPGFTSEYRWGWHGYFWARQPVLDQSQLEAWSGATPSAAQLSGNSVYLYSSLGNVRHVKLRTAVRSWIVFWASGATLILGLILIYVPRIRHPATLFVLAVVLLGAGIAAPEPAILLAQAASLGLALAVLAGVLDWGMARRRVKPAPSDSVRLRVEPGSTRSPYRVPAPSNPSSTQTMPALPPEARNPEL